MSYVKFDASKKKFCHISKKKIVIFQVRRKKNFVIFSGIGNPHTFYDTLKSFKIKFYQYEKFPDHYDYKESDLQRLKSLAKLKNCDLLTTEKDYFRIKKSFRKNINYLKVELSVDQKKQFYKYLSERL